MTKFTVRVELRNPQPGDYDRLHENMEAKRFLRTIEDSNGVKYKLPNAEYNYSSSESRQDVLDKAKSIANGVRSNSMILVTESGGRTWSKLDNA